MILYYIFKLKKDICHSTGTKWTRDIGQPIKLGHVMILFKEHRLNTSQYVALSTMSDGMMMYNQLYKSQQP